MKLTKTRVLAGLIGCALGTTLGIGLTTSGRDAGAEPSSPSDAVASTVRATERLALTSEPRKSDVDDLPRSAVAPHAESVAHESATETSDSLRDDTPIVLTAVAVDERGVPVEHFWLTVTVEDSKPPLVLPAVRDPASGVFEVRADGFPSMLEVRAGAQGYSDAFLAHVAAGTRNLRITLSRVARIVCDVVTDPNIDIGQLALRVVVGKSSFLQSNGRSEHGHYDLNVKAGTARVEVVVQQTSWVIETIDDVHAPSGATVSDGRVARIDVRGKVRELQLQLRDQNGVAFAGKAIRIQNSQGRGREFRADGSGRIALLMPSNMSTVHVVNGQSDRIEVPWSSEEQQLTFVRE